MKIIAKSNRTRLLAGILLALLLAALFAAVFPWLRNRAEPLFLPDENSPQMAAKRGAEIFYSLDYRQSHEEWVESLCSVSTEGGCALAELAAPNLWAALQEAKTRTKAQVEVIAKHPRSGAEGAAQVKSDDIASFSEDPTQVWELYITLSEPLPGQSITKDTAYAAVVQEEGTWKFERILMEAETAGWDSVKTENSR